MQHFPRTSPGDDGEGEPSATEDNEPRSRARAAIRSGALPSRPALRVWGGPGSGARCALCGEQLLASFVEVELEFAQTESDQPPRSLHLHPRCLTAWQQELASGILSDPPARPTIDDAHRATDRRAIA